jgi:hypothetical protein
MFLASFTIASILRADIPIVLYIYRSVVQFDFNQSLKTKIRPHGGLEQTNLFADQIVRGTVFTD